MPNTPPAKGLNAKTGGIKHKWWLLGGLGIGAVGYIYYARQSAANTVDPDMPAADTAGDAYDPYAGYDTGYGTNSGGAYGAAYTDPAAAQAAAAAEASAADSAAAINSLADALSAPVDTNQDWMHHAIHSLEEAGYTHAQARHAVLAYLAGAPLTKKQAHTVESAVGRLGPPPQTPPSIVIVNPHNGHAGETKNRNQKGGDGAKSAKTTNKPAEKNTHKRKSPFPWHW